MLKNISKLECKIGEKPYQLLCDIDSPISDAKEALFQFAKYLGQLEDNAKIVQQNEIEQSSPSKEKVVE